MSWRALMGGTVLAGLAAAGCGAQARPPASVPPVTVTTASVRVAPEPVRVAVVVLENKNPEQLLRTGWLARQARAGGRALNAVGETHPSLGNYLAMISGSTQGVHDDDV